MTHFDLEVCALWLPSCVVVALPLTRGWVACNPKRFFPAEHPGGAGSGPDETVLRASVCHGLLLAAALQPGEVLLDPMAGSAAIAVEVGHLPASQYISSHLEARPTSRRLPPSGRPPPASVSASPCAATTRVAPRAALAGPRERAIMRSSVMAVWSTRAGGTWPRYRFAMAAPTW